MADARIHNTGLSVVMFDLDCFKRINDTFGHDSGDVVLKNTKLRVRELLRGSIAPRALVAKNSSSCCAKPALTPRWRSPRQSRSKIATVPYDLVGAVKCKLRRGRVEHERRRPGPDQPGRSRTLRCQADWSQSCHLRR